MTQASRDENHITTILGVSNADGVTTLSIYANPTNHGLTINDGLAGSDLSGDVDARDENRVVAFMAVSAVDGVTPVPVYADSLTNAILVRSA
jgi:hypothetical protein